MAVPQNYIANYQKLFDTMQIKPGYQSQITAQEKKISAGKSKYKAIEAITNVPWVFIGLLHNLEAGNDFTKHLHNGDPLTARTTHVPSGRPLADPAAGKGKPYSFTESAVDALRQKELDKVKDWTIPEMLYQLERFNGFGYRSKGINSPYLWSFSNHYTKGKYVADGVYDPNAVSKQAGAAVILKSVMQRNGLIAAGMSIGFLLLTGITLFF